MHTQNFEDDPLGWMQRQNLQTQYALIARTLLRAIPLPRLMRHRDGHGELLALNCFRAITTLWLRAAFPSEDAKATVVLQMQHLEQLLATSHKSLGSDPAYNLALILGLSKIAYPLADIELGNILMLSTETKGPELSGGKPAELFAVYAVDDAKQIDEDVTADELMRASLFPTGSRSRKMIAQYVSSFDRGWQCWGKLLTKMENGDPITAHVLQIFISAPEPLWLGESHGIPPIPGTHAVEDFINSKLGEAST